MLFPTQVLSQFREIKMLCERAAGRHTGICRRCLSSYALGRRLHPLVKMTQGGMNTMRTKQAFPLTEALGNLWCRLIHDAPMWPIHGEYQCRVCLRRYGVPWAEEPHEASLLKGGPAMPTLNGLHPFRNS